MMKLAKIIEFRLQIKKTMSTVQFMRKYDMHYQCTKTVLHQQPTTTCQLNKDKIVIGCQCKIITQMVHIHKTLNSFQNKIQGKKQ